MAWQVLDIYFPPPVEGAYVEKGSCIIGFWEVIIVLPVLKIPQGTDCQGSVLSSLDTDTLQEDKKQC